MYDDDPGFDDGAIAGGARVAGTGRAGRPANAFSPAPVPEPEVVRAAQRGWRRWIGARRGARGAADRALAMHGAAAPLPTVTIYGVQCPDAAAAARLAADKIAAARQQLRLDLASERHSDASDGWRLLPEHLAIAATLMLTLGNAAWHYMA